MTLTASAALVVFAATLTLLETWSLSPYGSASAHAAVSAVTALLYSAGLHRARARRPLLVRRASRRRASLR